jgi:hypothetical protein
MFAASCTPTSEFLEAEMSLTQVGLVDTTGKLDSELVQAVAAALNVQVQRDLPQYWNVKATVLFLPNSKKIPSGVWPVRLVKSLPPGEGGFHLDQHNQPYAKVIATPDSDGWTVAASHETLEMLVDPAGNRLQASRSIDIVKGKIQDGTGEFEYLVEACDPCEADNYGYSIQGVAVSDFITPHFYDPVTVAGTRYSFTGAIKAPRQILPGGYISFINQETNEWQQIQYVDPKKPPQLIDLGPASGKSLREWIDNAMQTTAQLSLKPTNRPLLQTSAKRRESLSRIAVAKARLY